MENQHKKITGYRDFDQETINKINEIKELANQVGELVHSLFYLVDEDGETTTDARWVNIGKTHLQQGFMALVRSVAQPGSF